MIDDDNDVHVDACTSSEQEKKLSLVGVGCDLRNKDITESQVLVLGCPRQFLFLRVRS